MRTPVDVNSDNCRLALTPHLDLPPISDLELDNTSLTSEARAAEAALRLTMLAGGAFEALRIPERVARLQATGG